MATYYVDPTATGDDDGSSQANAWKTIQRAISGTDGTKPAAGDTVLCRHTATPDETPAAMISTGTGNAGSVTDGYIHYVGVNSSWTEDDSRYHISGASLPASTSLFELHASYKYLSFRNILWSHAKSSNITSNTSNTDAAAVNFFFNNCGLTNATSNGIGTYIGKFVLFRCLIANNGATGIWRPIRSDILFCRIHNNSTGLLIYHGGSSVVGNVFYANSVGIDCDGPNGNLFLNNVIDGQTSHGIDLSANGSHHNCIIGNRITNNGGYGINVPTANRMSTYEMYNFFRNNTSGTIGTNNMTAFGDSLTSGTEGYEDKSARDYNLTDDATLRRAGIVLP